MSAIEVQDILRRLGVRPTKERGQNFLIDMQAIDQIIEFGRPKAEDTVLEIGPGLGVLTGELIRKAAKFTAIELEEAFCRHLREEYPGIEIIEQDIRTVDFSELGQGMVVFGNLPYSLSTDIIFHLLSFPGAISRAVLLLQKEFALRVASPPGSRQYGAISAGAQLLADVRTGPAIGAESFHPVPKVDSQILELRFLPEPRVPGVDRFWYRRTVQACFFRRRKKLLNSIRSSHIFADVDVAEALAAAAIDPKCRAETLSVEQFARLSEVLRRNVSGETI